MNIPQMKNKNKRQTRQKCEQKGSRVDIRRFSRVKFFAGPFLTYVLLRNRLPLYLLAYIGERQGDISGEFTQLRETIYFFSSFFVFFSLFQHARISRITINSSLMKVTRGIFLFTARIQAIGILYIRQTVQVRLVGLYIDL